MGNQKLAEMTMFPGVGFVKMNKNCKLESYSLVFFNPSLCFLQLCRTGTLKYTCDGNLNEKLMIIELSFL